MIYLKEGNIPLNLAYDDSISQEANSTYQLSFKFPLNDEKWTSLKKEVFLLADDLHGEQEFFIGEVTRENGFVQVYAKQVATLLNYYSIGTLSVDRVEGQVVMSELAGSIKRSCPFTFFSDILDRHTFNQSNVSVIEALSKDDHSIIGQWGGDLVRDKYQVKLLKNGGSESEALFMYKKNLSAYKEKDSVEKLRTRIHFTKTIKETSGASEQVISVTVDSPLINKYSQIYEGNVEVTDQDVKDLATLKEYAKNYYASTLCDVAENSIELSVKDQDADVKMFDVVSVFHERFDVDLRLKITKYVYSPMSKRLKSVGFGSVSRSLGSTITGMVNNAVDRATGGLSANFEAKLQKEIDNANKHVDAEFDKRVESINDGIERAKADAEVYADGIKQEIAGEMAKSNQQYQLDKQAQDKQITDVLAKASASVNLATDAKNISSQAKSEAIAEANRLVELSKTSLTDQIKSVDVKVDDVANQIAAKVSQTDYDKLTGRMTNAETKLVTQAGQIAERLTRTEISSLVDSKGYQTASQVQQIVTKSADTLTQTISQVESKIPTNSSGRNYALGTSNSYFGGYGKISTLSTEAKGWSTSQKLYLTFDYVASGTVNGFRVNRVVEYSDGTSWQWNNTTDINKYGKEYIDTSAVKSGTYSGVWRWEPFVNNKTADKIKEIYLNLNLEDGSSGNVIIKRLRVNVGTVSSDWSPAPEDFATVTAFNQVRDTVTSHTQTIMEHSSAISQVVQTAQGLVSRVADLTASGNLVYDPTYYSKYREREPNSNLVMTGTTGYQLLRITQSGRTSDGWRGFQMPLHSQKFVAGEKLSYRVNLWVDVLPDAKVGFEIKAGDSIGGFAIQPTRTGPAQIFTGTFTISKTVTKTDDFGLHVWLEKNGTVAFGQLSIVRGEQPPQSFVDSTSSMQLATETQVSQLAGTYSIKNINSAGDILSQANLSSSQFLLEASKIRLKGQTLADEITAIDGKFNKLFVADGTFGKLNANIIDAEAISGGQIKFDQAFFNKMTANEAYLKQLFAKNAFITQVQSVTVSAAKITGGIMAATNGAMRIDMNNGQSLFYTDSAALKRVLSGYPTQFVKFATGKVDGVGSAGVTVIGSNRYGTESSNDGGFIGIRAWNSNKIDSLDLVGDTISMVASAYQSPQGFSINTWNNGGSPKIATLGSNAQKRDARIEIGDVYLYYNYNGNVVSLKQVLDNIFKNFQSLNAATAFNGQGYYSWWN